MHTLASRGNATPQEAELPGHTPPSRAWERDRAVALGGLLQSLSVLRESSDLQERLVENGMRKAKDYLAIRRKGARYLTYRLQMTIVKLLAWRLPSMM